MVIFHLASVMSGQGEKDFDLCWRAAGMKHVVSATLLGRGCKFIFASSGACFGERPPGPETDGTKLLPETSYGKLFLLLGLPTQLLSLQALPPFPTLTLPLRRNGHGLPNREPNSGLPAAFSDVLREPLWKRDCILPLPPDLRHAVCGYRVLVRNLIHLANLPAAAFESSDRCMNLPCRAETLEVERSAFCSVRASGR
ncbi:D-erythronate dehydrogenase [Durusdinium trenchii]|uniref:D-erythronate dehydrogenase n=1 Tax=Durusdinium trenchii TaxID=1381693 RepID=A0ABP0LKC7_9DINO